MSGLTNLDSFDEISKCKDADALLAELAICTTDLVTNLARMAAIIRRLDDLGVQVSLEHSLLPYVRMIAKGSLSARCFVACSGEIELLRCVVGFPLHLQEKIANNEPFKVMDQTGGHRLVPVLEMSKGEIRQVFTLNGERPEVEQVELLNGRLRATSRRIARQAESGTAPLPRVPGGRCSGCGARLLVGAKCVSCEIEAIFAERSIDQADNDSSDDELPDGWQERYENLRRLKESGNELNFHVDWLLSYIEDASDGLSESESARLRILAVELSRFVDIQSEQGVSR